MRRPATLGGALVVLLLSAQAAWVGRCAVTDVSYFCFDPHNVAVAYEIEVVVGGAELPAADVARRYGLPGRNPVGWEAHTVHNVFDLVRRVENRLDPADRGAVRVRYRVNDGAWEAWTWPD